jgi:hypothetical protein
MLVVVSGFNDSMLTESCTIDCTYVSADTVQALLKVVGVSAVYGTTAEAICKHLQIDNSLVSTDMPGLYYDVSMLVVHLQYSLDGSLEPKYCLVTVDKFGE